jgi:hypothetical protein
MTRHAESFRSFDFGLFETEQEGDVRVVLQDFFAGPEDNYPEGLVADLHRIAELGDAGGLELILERARRQNVSVLPLDAEGSSEHPAQDPKQVALRTFLQHPAVFEAASDMLAYRTMSSCAEFAGDAEAIDADVSGSALTAFQKAAEQIFEANLRGRYCRVRCFEDDGEINLVVTHGAPFKTTDTLEDGEERVISFRELEHAVLSYTPATGRLKIGGVAKAQREELAEVFAAEMLQQPGFFSAPDAQHLYTLKPVSDVGTMFAFDHEFDPMIHKVQIVELQADRVGVDPTSGEERSFWSLVVRDSRDDALDRLEQLVPGFSFATGEWQLNHITIRVHINAGISRPTKVTVKIKPPGAPTFKRQRFENRIMILLRRNGIAHDRQPAEAASAAE